MKPGKDTLWSTDIFGTAAAKVAESLAPVDLGGVSGRMAPASPTSAAAAAARPPVSPERERAYLRFGRPALQMLATREGREARFSEIRDFLAARDPDFDFDDLRRALSELERREAVEIAERDPHGGDHLYRLTKIGWVLAA